MALLWNGDLETGDVSQLGDFEYGGTFDGSPPLSDRVTVATSIDGYSAAQGNYFMRIKVAPGDQYGGSTGWRTIFRQASPIPLRSAGYDSAFAWCALWPDNWPDAANVWLSGMEMHHTGTTVAPSHFIAYAGNMHIDVFGGIETSMTRYIYQDILTGYSRNTWYVFVARYKHGLAPNGIYQLWYGKLGTDVTMHQLVDASGIGTMFSGFQNYLLMGHYRAQSGSGVTTFYMDGMREYSTSAEALSYATGILTGSPPPPPDSTPQSTSAPVITGSALVGSTLSCTTGSWSPAPSSYAYQWQRQSSPSSGSYTNISGETTNTYVTTSNDVGRNIRCEVTAT